MTTPRVKKAATLVVGSGDLGDASYGAAIA
jgi:hypothetical protein